MPTYISREIPFHPKKRINWRTILITVAIALSTPAVMGMLSYVRTTWNDKESATDHKADIAAINAKLQRILDVSCLGHVEVRQCKEPTP